MFQNSQCMMIFIRHFCLKRFRTIVSTQKYVKCCYCNLTNFQGPLIFFLEQIVHECEFSCFLWMFNSSIQTYHSRTGFEPLDLRKSLDLSPPLWAATCAAAARLLQLLLKNPLPEGPPRPGPRGPPPSIKAVVAVSLSLWM